MKLPAWLDRWLRLGDPAPVTDQAIAAEPDPQALIAELRSRCDDLQERLATSEQRLRERSELLYDLQQHYASEHFGLQESMRNLKIERLRNAGIFADRDIIIDRARTLQERIRELKSRLQQYETVDDRLFDDQPIVLHDTPPETT